MTNTDLAWAAGVFDGEGCININRHFATKGQRRRSDSFRLGTKVTMGHLPTVERLQQILGVGTIQHHASRGVRINASFSWLCQCQLAGEVLTRLLPYLVTKKEEAVLAVEFLALPSGAVGGRGGNPPHDPTALEQKLRYYWELRMLKPRWRFYLETLTEGELLELHRLRLL